MRNKSQFFLTRLSYICPNPTPTSSHVPLNHKGKPHDLFYLCRPFPISTVDSKMPQSNCSKSPIKVVFETRAETPCMHATLARSKSVSERIWWPCVAHPTLLKHRRFFFAVRLSACCRTCCRRGCSQGQQRQRSYLGSWQRHVACCPHARCRQATCARDRCHRCASRCAPSWS